MKVTRLPYFEYRLTNAINATLDDMPRVKHMSEHLGSLRDAIRYIYVLILADFLIITTVKLVRFS